jgi:cystathionine beta-lyase/cystathionine gamma-synthase
MERNYSKLTQCVHAGSHGDSKFGGAVTPIFPASAYDYELLPEGTLYPRYFNTPNQKVLANKLAVLENAEEGLVFSSGLAAILTSVFAIMQKGDHAVFPSDLYGGTHHAVISEFPRFGMEYTFVDASEPHNIERSIKSNTKVIYLETPSNPTLKITDIPAVATIARKHGLISIIDNTFASPVNQNPIDLGVDIVTHSGTKYIGGHLDICCGAALASHALIEKIRARAIHFGGSLDPQTCWLAERSLKTLALRVRQQNRNAQTIAEYLESDSRVGKVYYPGLKSHANHETAGKQMTGGFGGMLSFEVKGDAHVFMSRLKLIRRAISLGGVESTITSPAKTSHVKMSGEERAAIGVSDALVRLSTGIEEAVDLIEDIKQALP